MTCGVIMTQRINVFTTKAGAGAKFTVNVAATSVDLTPLPGVGVYSSLFCGIDSSVAANRYFDHGECFTILSAGFVMPENFVLSNPSVVGGAEMPVTAIQLRLNNITSTVAVSIPQFGNGGYFRFPFSDYEMSIGTFVESVPLGMTEKFELQALFPVNTALAYPQVSMMNVPAALDGLDFEVTPFVKILHNSGIGVA